MAVNWYFGQMGFSLGKAKSEQNNWQIISTMTVNSVELNSQGPQALAKRARTTSVWALQYNLLTHVSQRQRQETFSEDCHNFLFFFILFIY